MSMGMDTSKPDMKITAICLTYRRPELLNEALQSFLMQDYAGAKELIILNDESEQKLRFNHPQVIVKNMPDRAPDLPSKYNYAVSMASGDLIVPWDDDDIYLPHRLTSIASRQQNGLWFTDHLYTDTTEGELELVSGKIHCNHAFSQQMFLRFGAYHDHPELSFDFILMNQLRAAAELVKPDNIKPSYIYRKNSTASKNHSTMYLADTDEQYRSYAEANADFTNGEIELRPAWSCDWQSLADQALARNPIPAPLHEKDPCYKQPKTTPCNDPAAPLHPSCI